MTSHHRSATRKRTDESKRPAKAPDAVAILEGGHRDIEELFSQFEKARSSDRKKELAGKICQLLRLHMQLEEEIFYPASREFLRNDDIVDESVAEHVAAKEVMDEIQDMSVGDALFEPRMAMLRGAIDHHIKEEESEYFPAVKKTDMDLGAVGERLQHRFKELMAQAT